MEWLDTEIKLFISTEGPFNLYVIDHYFESCPLTPLMLSVTPASAAFNNLFITKPPSPTNVSNI